MTVCLLGFFLLWENHVAALISSPLVSSSGSLSHMHTWQHNELTGMQELSHSAPSSYIRLVVEVVGRQW